MCLVAKHNFVGASTNMYIIDKWTFGMNQKVNLEVNLLTWISRLFFTKEYSFVEKI